MSREISKGHVRLDSSSVELLEIIWDWANKVQYDYDVYVTKADIPELINILANKGFLNIKSGDASEQKNN